MLVFNRVTFKGLELTLGQADEGMHSATKGHSMEKSNHKQAGRGDSKRNLHGFILERAKEARSPKAEGDLIGVGMAAVESGSSQASENKNFAGWKLCALPWWQKGSSERRPIVSRNHSKGRPPVQKQQSLVAIAKASLLTRRRLRLDPDGKLFFLCLICGLYDFRSCINGTERNSVNKIRETKINEPGKQVSSAVRIKNISRSFVAFKFQTNAPKSCFMRPPNGILAPNESMVTSVVKFVEQPEHSQEKKTRDKFKIVSLKVKEGVEYTPELFEENKELLAVEKVLRVVFLDPQRPSKELEKLKKRLAEAEATNQARKKPQDDKASKPAAPTEGVLDEWKERREKYLARQQVEGSDSV
eukprot:Gb_35009 [translate_table: standard]